MPVTATPTRAAEFRETLAQRVWVADGAMGTALYAKGAFLNRCYDELNLSLPALGARRSPGLFARGGADSRDQYLWGESQAAGGVWIRREAAADQPGRGADRQRSGAGPGFCGAGSIGPLGVRLEPLGHLGELRRLVSICSGSRLKALVEAGVDLIILESFRDLDELREAVLAVREAAGREMPLIAQVAIEDDGTLEDGTSAANIALALTQWPVDVIGLNCSSGPRVLLEAIEAMAPLTTKPLSVMPNAGLPVTVDGRNLYLCSPEYMAQYARRFLGGGGEDRGRLLRHHGRAHQGNSQRGAQLSAGQAHTVQVEEPRSAARSRKFRCRTAGLGAKLAAGTIR